MNFLMSFSCLIACVAVVLAIASSSSFAAGLEPAPTLKVPTVNGADVKIDGTLDDEIWKRAAVSDHFRLTDGQATKGKARMLVAQDDKNLYLAVEVFGSESDLKNLIVNHHQHDARGIWDDDVVEVFIDPTNQRQAYYEFIINSQGVTFDAFHQKPGHADTSWDPKYQSATKVGKTSWIAEFALPLNMFDKHPRPTSEWMLNVLVFRTIDNEFCYWSPVYQESAHAPAQFGTLTGLVIPAGLAKPAPASQPASGPTSKPAGK
jgi:hypothetical protein